MEYIHKITAFCFKAFAWERDIKQREAAMTVTIPQKTTNSSAKSRNPKAKKTTKEAKVQARIEPELKHDAEAIFEELGVSPTEAIRMFYAQVKMHRGFPFAVKIPNDVTLAALEETEHPENLETLEDDFFDNL